MNSMSWLKTLSQKRAARSASSLLFVSVGIAFFLTVLLIGLAVYDDYGISFDEPTQVEYGILTYRFVMKQDPALTGWHGRYYGPFFEILLVMLQSRGASRDLYLSRHLLNFLCYFAGLGAFFFLANRFVRARWLALLGCVFLVLSPRLFADAFYNSKDIPFFVFYLFTLLSLLWFADRPRFWPRGMLHGLLSAALITIRIPGLLIVVLTAAALLFEMTVKRVDWLSAMKSGAAYLLATFLLCIFFWPTLWTNPASQLAQSFQLMSHYPYLTAMLYQGQVISSGQVPWHYIPVWILVTTPLLYLVLFGFGLTCFLTGWKTKAASGNPGALRDELLLLSAFFLPLLIVIVLGSSFYNGWRQMFFIYAPFLVIAVKGMETVIHLIQGKFPGWRSRLILTGILGFGLLPVGGWMIANHPYQYLYFNRLAGPDYKTVQQRFDMDYWELNYKEGLAYILENDPSDQITVFGQTSGGQRNLALFPTHQARRIVFVDRIEDAVYYLANYARPGETYPFQNEVFSAQVGNAKVLSVFLLSAEEKQ
jgi:hypothetical protein